MEPWVQFRIHKVSPITPILSRINQIPCIDTYFFKIHSNNVLPSTLRPELPRQISWISLLSHPCVLHIKSDIFIAKEVMVWMLYTLEIFIWPTFIPKFQFFFLK